MDSFEWNKVFGAFLAVAFVVLGVTFLSDGIYHADDPEVAGFEIEGGEVEVAANSVAAPTVDPVLPILAAALPADGEKVARKCVSCHNFEKGSANKVGPQLWDIVNRDIAGIDGFGYSGALTEYGEGKQWTYDELNGFLWKPKAHVKGTSMGFAGIKKVEERASLISYLRSLSDNPAPIAPAPAAADAADAEAPATDASAAPATTGDTVGGVPATDNVNVGRENGTASTADTIDGNGTISVDGTVVGDTAVETKPVTPTTD